MNVIDIISQRKKTAFSFELLPPLKGNNIDKLYDAIDVLREFDPAYINITDHRSEYVFKELGDGTYMRQRLRRRPGSVAVAAAIKNIGMPMKYSGDGLDIRGSVENGTFIQTLANRSASYEMPANLSLGLSYDFLFGSQSGAEKAFDAEDAIHRLTLSGTFISNAYSNDQYIVGLEYSWKEIFQLRGGFTMENELFDKDAVTTLYSGPSAGASILIPMGKESGSKAMIDYAYRFTNKWKGCHFIGIRLAL